ncbi:MAG: hypothetical protein GY928_34240 [Colwellia sp.]|nr:hypothetical protein [Colwellia sp.]
MYHLGSILKSKLRSDDYPLYVMVCNDEFGQLDQTPTQFRAIVLLDATDENKVGEVFNNWNKGKWIGFSLY